MDRSFFVDGLGRRVRGQGTAGEQLESLRLCTEIGDGPAVQAALVARAAGLGDFQHPAFARVRRIERYTGIARGLAVVSEAPEGIRLSDLLRQAERSGIDLGLDAGLCLIKQVVAAVAALHAHARDAAHGAIGPERVVVQVDGSAILVEHVLAKTLEELQLSRSRLWELFRVPVPSVAGMVRFDQQTDVIQLGVLALSLLLGRVLLRGEFPHRLAGVLEEAATLDACRERHEGVPLPVRTWVARALQLDSRSGFRNAIEADSALSAAMAANARCRPTEAAVQAFVAKCSADATSPSATGRVPRGARGATVLVGPLPDTTTRIARSTEADEVDRGSGAHRVLRTGHPAEPEPSEIQVLADLTPPPGVEGALRTPASPSVPIVPPPSGEEAERSSGRMLRGVGAWRIGLGAIGLAFRRK